MLIIDYSCVPGCWNGGSCSSQNVCTCATGFQGDRCQTSKIVTRIYNLLKFFFTAICNVTCINGRCVEPYVCTCQGGWNGTFCDQRKFKSSKIMNELYITLSFFQLSV